VAVAMHLNFRRTIPQPLLTTPHSPTRFHWQQTMTSNNPRWSCCDSGTPSLRAVWYGMVWQMWIYTAQLSPSL